MMEQSFASSSNWDDSQRDELEGEPVRLWFSSWSVGEIRVRIYCRHWGRFDYARLGDGAGWA